MREILFRGFYPDEHGSKVIKVDGKEIRGYWVEGYYWTNKFGNHFIRVNVIDCDYNLKDYEVIPETVGEYTGLNDKSGKMIFEGDIVQTKYGKAIIGFDECRGFGGYSDKRGIIGGLVFLTGCDLSFGEVIGNVFENPEMVEKQGE